MSDVNMSMGTLYDFNKAAMQNVDALTKEEIKEKMNEIQKFFKKYNDYFMMLCHEKRDYTIFHLGWGGAYAKAAAELEECLANRGTIYSIEEENGNAYEIWIKDFNGEFSCYYLFPYDEAVIRC